MTEGPRVTWFSRITWFVILAGLVGFTLPLVAWTSARMRHLQTTDELRNLHRMLGEFRQRYGGWPPASTTSQLISALRGQMDARGKRPEVTQSFLVGTRFYFKDAAFEGPGAAIVDPWNRPYVYRFFRGPDGLPAGYTLFSAGPDGRYSNPARWSRGQNGTAAEDDDNICVFSDKR